MRGADEIVLKDSASPRRQFTKSTTLDEIYASGSRASKIKTTWRVADVTALNWRHIPLVAGVVPPKPSDSRHPLRTISTSHAAGAANGALQSNATRTHDAKKTTAT